MIEIKKEVQRTEEIITYVSVDGKEFKTKEDCEKWEKSYEGTIRAALKEIPHFKTYCEDAYIVSFPSERVIVLKPRNMEDIMVINAYGKIINSFTEPLTQDDIGEVLMIHTGCDEDWFEVYRMDAYLQEVINNYNNFKMQIEEHENDKKRKEDNE